MIATATAATYADGTLTLRRWRVRQAVAAMQRARRDADDEAAATVRRLRPSPAASTRTPQVVTASWPPELLVAALIIAAVTVGGVVGLGSRYDVAAMRRAVDADVATASGATEWRDGEVGR